MRTIVATAILCLVLLLGTLVIYILLRRGASVALDSYRRKRRALLETRLDEWLASRAELPPRSIAKPRTFIDREVLIDLSLERLPTARGSAAVRLRYWLRDSGMVRRWNRDLASRSAWRRSHAAERLAAAHAPESLPLLIRALQDPVFDVRMRAAKALGAVGGPKARRALIEALGDRSRWSVIRIADLLAEMGPEVVDELLAAYPGMDRDSRLATLELITRVGDARMTPFLVGQLDDLDRDIRARAAAALGKLSDSRGLQRLEQALGDEEWPVRAIAAKALGMLRAVDATDALAMRLRDAKWWVRANAAQALCQLGDRGTRRLVEMLGDQDQFARDQALGALENSGELARRLECLGMADPAARQPGRRLVQTLLSYQPRGRVEALRDRHPDPQVRREFDAVLREHQGSEGDAS